MLIQAYDVRILRCGSCGGPIQIGPAGKPAACGYCGADTQGAGEVSAFSRDIRVLACEGCAAPLGVPIGGGRITCEFCHHTTEIVARRDVPLGSGGRVDDPDRIARLRRQDKPHVFLPAKLGRLMRRGGLVDETAEQAETMWNEHRAILKQATPEQRGSKAMLETEKNFFSLTELIVDYHNWKQRRLVARGFLEAALGDIEDPRYLQALYGWMARNAEMTGDSASADQWLELCDPAPDDLEMDSAVRFTWASLALRRGDLVGVLKILGRSRREVPLLSKYDTICDLYRAHAKERLEGAEAGVGHLEAALGGRRGLAWRRGDWLSIISSVEASPELDLCPESLRPAVEREWSWWPKPIIGTVLAIVFFGALFTDALFGPTLWGERALGWGAIPIGVLVGGQIFAYAYIYVTTTRKIRRELDSVERGRRKSSG